MEPYEGREPYIFISYASRDAERVTPYLEALTGAGYRVWYDKGIKAGADWLDTLLEKVEKCEVFCPLFSEAFTDSRYCYLETEWAHRKRKNIVPLHLEKMKQDGMPRLYQLLQGLQDLRLYDCANAAEFVDGLGGQPAFAPCKAPEWNKTGQIQWRLSADGVLSIAKNEDLPSLYHYGVIPPYQYDPVYRGSTAPWMKNREKILSVVIANDMIEIGKHAFENCKNLTDVHIPDSVTSIGNFAFEGCESLTNARIGNRVKTINDFAFHSCASLTNIFIPDSVNRIGSLAFACCYRLTDVRISNNVTEISDDVFMDCKSLTNIRIPDSVTKIGGGAFYGCERLTEALLPDDVTKIGIWAFRGCQCLKSIEIPAGAEVAEDAFPAHTRVIRRAAPR